MSRITFLRILGFAIVASSAHAQEPACFSTTEELRSAVDAYLADPSEGTEVAKKYGWPIGNWCVRFIQDFSDLFANMRNPLVETFNEDLTNWVTVNARDFSYMFAGAKAFNGDISNFETGRVKTMQGMFEEANSFDGDISKWNVFNNKDFSYMFHGAWNFSGDISQWNTLCAQDLSYMFYTANRFNSDLSKWNVAGVYDFRYMFDDTEIFAQNLCPWNAKISKELSTADFNAMFLGSACPIQDAVGPATEQGFIALCFPCDIESS